MYRSSTMSGPKLVFQTAFGINEISVRVYPKNHVARQSTTTRPSMDLMPRILFSIMGSFCSI